MKNAQIVWYFLILLCIFGLAGQAQAQDASLGDRAREGTSPEDFVPNGWKVDFQVSGDLNGDGVPDVAAILIEDKREDDRTDADEGPKHAFIVLLGADNGKFLLAGTNFKLLQCKGCGGVKEFVDIQIKKGVVVVSQMSGSREYTYSTWRFRYDQKLQRFILIGMDIEEGDNVLGKKKIVSSNYLTGLKTIQEGKKTSSSTMNGINTSRQALFLEDVVE
ncbi:MAG: hypothetical protein HQK81_04095 [Desulfovibrionaceae bacterium]|nr:hypothetical protein [Desulfovibrionaceae bacterium]MBF0513225.1 hypothetical protein [Desulfovibrionaceae bacterium]